MLMPLTFQKSNFKKNNIKTNMKALEQCFSHTKHRNGQLEILNLVTALFKVNCNLQKASECC